MSDDSNDPSSYASDWQQPTTSSNQNPAPASLPIDTSKTCQQSEALARKQAKMKRTAARRRQERAKKAAELAPKLEQMSEKDRAEYNKRNRLRSYGVDPNKEELTFEDELQIVEAKAKQAAAQKRKYDRMTPKEKSKFNEQYRKRHKQYKHMENMLFSLPVEQAAPGEIEMAREFAAKRQRDAEQAKSRYQQIKAGERLVKRRKPVDEVEEEEEDDSDEKVDAPDDQGPHPSISPTPLFQQPQAGHLIPADPSPSDLQAQKLAMQKARKAELARLRYQKKTEEQKKERNQQIAAQKNQKRMETLQKELATHGTSNEMMTDQVAELFGINPIDARDVVQGFNQQRGLDADPQLIGADDFAKRIAEKAKERYHRMSKEERSEMNWRKDLAKKAKREQQKLDELAGQSVRIQDDLNAYDDQSDSMDQPFSDAQKLVVIQARAVRDPNLTEEEKEMERKRKAAENARMRYHYEMTEDEYEQRKIRTAQGQKRKYNEMTPEERREFNRKRYELEKERRQKEKMLLAAPIGAITEAQYQQAERIAARIGRTSARERLRYSNMTDEQKRKKLDQRKVSRRRMKEKEQEAGVQDVPTFHANPPSHPKPVNPAVHEPFHQSDDDDDDDGIYYPGKEYGEDWDLEDL